MIFNLVLRSRKRQFREQISNIRSREVSKTLRVALHVGDSQDQNLWSLPSILEASFNSRDEYLQAPAPLCRSKPRHSKLAQACTSTHIHPQKYSDLCPLLSGGRLTGIHLRLLARASLDLKNNSSYWTGLQEGTSKFTSFSSPLSSRVSVVLSVLASFCHWEEMRGPPQVSSLFSKYHLSSGVVQRKPSEGWAGEEQCGSLR